MDYFFSAFETTRSKAKDTSLCPIAPGQYFICTDSGDVFYDTADGVRKHLTDIIDLETDAERAAILTPLDKMYFVKETAHFWRYLNGTWADLSIMIAGTTKKPYTKVFTPSDWSNHKLIIPASEHQQEYLDNTVLAKVYVLVNDVYSDQCLAAMDTEVYVSEDKSVILSYDGTAGYTGKVVLYR